MTLYVIAGIIYLAVLAGLSAVCCNDTLKDRFYIPVKMAESTLFLVLAAAIACHNSAFDRPAVISLMIGLVMCHIGDLAMGCYNIRRKKRFMACGMGFFMAAHVCFLIYMYALDPAVDIISIAAPVAVLVVGPIILAGLRLHMGKLRIPVIIYAVFVTAFASKAVMVSGIAMVAGILFWLSDVSLLFLYFFHLRSKRSSRMIHVFNLVTYYVAIGALIGTMV